MIRNEASIGFDRGARRASFVIAWQLGLSLVALVAASGCNAFGLGNGRAVQELRTENERLLTEFRAERDRRQEMEKQLRVMENRLAESEKLLARQYSPTDRRLSQLSSLPSTSPSGARAVPNSASPAPFSSDLQGLSGDPGLSADQESGLRWQRRVSP